MGRNTRTTVPIIPKELSPCLPNHSKLHTKETEMREILKKNFNSHHKARSLKHLIGENVAAWYVHRGKNYHGNCTTLLHKDTPSGKFWRNWQHIIPMPTNSSGEESTNKSEETSQYSPDSTQSQTWSPLDPNVTRTRSGHISKPPQRFYSSGQNWSIPKGEM